MSARRLAARWLLPLGLALIFVGYLAVWLPHPVAGLRLIGLEMGEWVKFLPAVHGGQLWVSRVWFYVPPLTLGVLLALDTVDWPARWQTWLARLLAALAATLALPALPVIMNEPRGEWLLRVILVALVGALALLVGAFGARLPAAWVAGAMLAVTLVGALLPTTAYLVMRPVIVDLLQKPVGIGVGVWLTLAGHLLVAVAVLGRRR